MFNNLVESGAHQADRRRTASFFIYTLAGYAVLLLAAGVASVYAYDSHLENQNLEILVFLAPPTQTPQAVQKDESPKVKAGGGEVRRESTRVTFISRVSENTTPPDKISATGSTTPEMPPGPVKLDDVNFNASPFGGVHGPPASSGDSGSRTNRSLVKIDDTDKPPPLKVEQPPKKPIVNKGSLITSQAISLPKPTYPSIARMAGVSGTVAVQILLDETGKVISARAISGNHLLQAEAVKAAYQARFSPTILTGQPVKVSGIITYNFIPR